MTANSIAATGDSPRQGRRDRSSSVAVDVPVDVAPRARAGAHDLKLLELLRTGTQRYELEHAAQHQIAERPEQEPTPQVSGTGARHYGRHARPRAGTALTHPT